MKSPNSDAVAIFFEWAMDNRKAKLLDNFSIGPTMMYLAQSGPFLSSGQPSCGFPATWDDIFAFYTASTIAAIAPRLTYLDQGCTGISGYPADHPDDDANNIKWLLHQVGMGSQAATEQYYIHGYGNAGADRNTGYHGALWRVINATQGM